MYKLVALAAFVASAATEADPVAAYAGGLNYGYAGLAAAPAAYAGLAAAPVAPVAAAAAHPALPAGYAASLPAPAKIPIAQPLTALPADFADGPAHIAHPVPAAAAPIPSPGLGLPEAATFVAPPVRQVAEPSIVEHTNEAVEQWGFKVAY